MVLDYDNHNFQNSKRDIPQKNTIRKVGATLLSPRTVSI